MKKICKYILAGIPILLTILFFIIMLYQNSVISLLNIVINSAVYNLNLSNQYYNSAYLLFSDKTILSIITIILEIFSMISILLIMYFFKKDVKIWWKEFIKGNKKKNKY